MLIYPENEWNIYDATGVMLPYYTHESLEWIQKNIPKTVTVLEIGGGNSTIWWRKNAKEVKTIESNEHCAKKIACDFVNFMDIKRTIQIIDKNFDVVIVDGDGDREWYVLDAWDKCGKYFIVDNWQQSEVMIYSNSIVDYLTSNCKECLIFKQANHKDWKTAIFIKH